MHALRARAWWAVARRGLPISRCTHGGRGAGLSATYEVIAWNDPAAALLEDFSPLSRRERDLLRRACLAPPSRERALYDPFDTETFARAAARRLRATAARYPDDREVATPAAELLAGSAQFARLWATHDVRPEPTLLKTVDHPLIGPITLDCTFLDITDQDQQLMLLTVEPGSPAEDALRLLSVIGTQRMDVSG